MELSRHPVKLLIFQQDERRRTRLCELLDDGATFSVVGQYARPLDAPLLHDGAIPDVVLFERPADDNIIALAPLRKQYDQALFVVYSMLDGDGNGQLPALSALLHTSEENLEALADRLRASLETGAPLSSTDLQTLLTFFPKIDAPSRYDLSKREKQVLTKMVEGLSNKQIAAVLRIGEDTVKKHLKNIYIKLEVNSGKMAVVKALRERLVL